MYETLHVPPTLIHGVYAGKQGTRKHTKENTKQHQHQDIAGYTSSPAHNGVTPRQMLPACAINAKKKKWEHCTIAAL